MRAPKKKDRTLLRGRCFGALPCHVPNLTASEAGSVGLRHSARAAPLPFFALTCS